MGKLKNKIILIVEDELIIALRQKLQLESEGYTILTASSGEQAIDIVCGRKEHVDLILMDVDLGKGLDGIDAADEILKEHDIPVVFLSSHAEKEIVQQAEKITSYGYILKDSGITVLNASIKIAFKLFESKMKEKKNFETLREYREIFRDLTDNAIVGIYLIQDDLFRYVNSMLGEISGYSTDVLIDKAGPGDIVFDEDWHIVEENIRGRISGEAPSGRYEFRIKTKSGGIRDVEVCSSRTFLHGKPAIIGTLLDMTERKQSELELSKISRLNRLITENMTEGVILTDMDMKIEFATPSVISRYGFSLDELNSIPIEQRMAKESYELMTKIVSEEMTPERLADPNLDILRAFELEYYRRDGSTCWSESTFRLIRDADGRPAGILGVGRDITERKQVENALFDSEESFRRLAEDIPAFICSFLPDSTMIYANHALADLTGISQDNLRGRKFFELLEHTDLENVKKGIQSLTPANPAESHEQSFTGDDGKKYYQEWRNRAFFNENGEVIRFLSVGMDITDRKIAEEQIQVLLREKELLLKEIHHRVINNMNTIFGLLSLQADMQKTPATKTILLEATSRVKSMMILYNKLYRSEIKTAISIKDYLPALINEIAAIFPKKDSVKISTQIDDIVLEERILSPLGIIINELITNSMKYAFTGRNDGVISVTAVRRGSLVSVVFEDNGPDIPESVTFDKPAGFGLQLVRMLVKQINGTVSIERGRGAKFNIEFEA